MDEATPQPHPMMNRGKRKLPLGGVILIIVGALWLLNNMGFSWASSIWVPVIVIVIGLYIVTKR